MLHLGWFRLSKGFKKAQRWYYNDINLGRPQPEIQWFVNNRQVEGGPTELKELDVISTFDFGTLSRQVKAVVEQVTFN